MTTTLNSNLSAPVTIQMQTEMLMFAADFNILGQFADTKRIDKNKGETASWRRPRLLAPNTTPLSEAVQPIGTNRAAYDRVNVTIFKYGDSIEFSDRVEDLAIDTVRMDFTPVLGRQAGDTVEQVCYGAIRAGTSVFFAGASTIRSNVNATVSTQRIGAMVRFLKQNKANMFTRVQDGSPKINTVPVPRSFVGVTHTDMQWDFEQLVGWRSYEQYAYIGMQFKGEIGRFGEVRVCLSPNLDPFFASGNTTLNGMRSVGGVAVDVYPVLLFGESAYAQVALKGADAIKPFVIPPGMRTKDDRHGQRGYIGWDAYTAATILNDLWLVRGEFGATNI